MPFQTKTVMISGVALLGTMWLVGCSADPYKGLTPAPPDRLTAPLATNESADTPAERGATGTIPAGDGSEALAPNDSGQIPRLPNQK
ncbi:MAG TPA: hypothetical protein VJN43_18345 [Bryobacteraceae bacterium]|nr:hypothetical protein [Bryobacteraceae bacterium]